MPENGMQIQKKDTYSRTRVRKTKDRIDLYYITMLCGTMAAQAGFTVDLVGRKDGEAYVIIDLKEFGKFKLQLPAIKVKVSDLTETHKAIQAYTKLIIEGHDTDGKEQSQ